MIILQGDSTFFVDAFKTIPQHRNISLWQGHTGYKDEAQTEGMLCQSWKGNVAFHCSDCDRRHRDGRPSAYSDNLISKLLGSGGTRIRELPKDIGAGVLSMRGEGIKKGPDAGGLTPLWWVLQPCGTCMCSICVRVPRVRLHPITNRPPLHYGFGSGILYCTYINELYCLNTNVIICVRRPRAIADRAGDQSIVALKEQWQKMNGKDKKKTI